MVAFKSLFVLAAAALATIASPLPGDGSALVAREAPGVDLVGLAARDVLVTRGDGKDGHGYDHDKDHGYGHDDDDDDKDDHGHGYGHDHDDDKDHDYGHDHDDDHDHDYGHGHDGHGHGGGKGGGKSLAEIIVDIHVEIKAQIKLIENAVKSKADFKVLIELVTKIDVIIKAGVDKVKGCKGKKTVDVNVFVDIFISIVVSLNTAVKGCGKENVKILLQIIVQINVSISVFLKSAFGQVSGLDVKFSALLDASVVTTVKNLGLVDVIAVIKVHLSVSLRAILNSKY